MGLSLKPGKPLGNQAAQGYGWAQCHDSGLSPEGVRWPPGECMSLDLLHAVHMVHRECTYSTSNDVHTSCVSQMLPLLIGALKAMKLHSYTDADGGPRCIDDVIAMLSKYTCSAVDSLTASKPAGP